MPGTARGSLEKEGSATGAHTGRSQHLTRDWEKSLFQHSSSGHSRSIWKKIHHICSPGDLSTVPALSAVFYLLPHLWKLRKCHYLWSWTLKVLLLGKAEFGWLIGQLWRLDFIWTNIHKCSLLVLKTKDYMAAHWWLFHRVLLRYTVLIIAWGAAACVRGITSGFDIPAWPRRDLFQTNFPLVFLRIFCLVSKYKKPEADLSGLFLFFPKQANTFSPSAHPVTAVS